MIIQLFNLFERAYITAFYSGCQIGRLKASSVQVDFVSAESFRLGLSSHPSDDADRHSGYFLTNIFVVCRQRPLGGSRHKTHTINPRLGSRHGVVCDCFWVWFCLYKRYMRALERSTSSPLSTNTMMSRNDEGKSAMVMHRMSIVDVDNAAITQGVRLSR